MRPRPFTPRPRRAFRMNATSSFLLLAVAACGGPEASPKPAATPQPAAQEPVATTAAPAPSVSAAPASSAPAAPASSSPAPSPSASASPLVASAPRPKMIAARHVLIQWMGCQNSSPSVIRTRDQAHALAVDVLRRLRAGEDFPRLVVEFSDEPNAGARGGSVGRFGHGAMVHEFEEAAFALKPNEISEIVESPFGFHVIQRTE
jgi:NIMA-interacting peptidyl-prolyl cis-trans isomerase 1